MPDNDYVTHRLPDSGMLIRLHRRFGYYYKPDPVYIVVRLVEGRNIGHDCDHDCWKTVAGVAHKTIELAREELEQIREGIQ